MKLFRILSLVISLSAVLMSCGKHDDDHWIESKDVAIIAYKSDPENGKQYLDVIYENLTTVNISKIKVLLVETKGTKVDTVERIIIPENIFKPKDRHLAKRPIGAPEATFDNIAVAKVWYVKE